MSFLHIFFMIISVGRVLARPLSLNLDIDILDNQHFKVEETQLDNVYYNHFTTKNGQFVTKVSQSGLKIWESIGYGRCVYALVSYDKALPNLLYLKIDKGYSVDHAFFKKVEGVWETVSSEKYRETVYELGRSVKIERQFTLDIASVSSDTYYTTVYASKEKPYTYKTPNVGYFANSVVYNSEKLWSATKFGDRCVAVWAYVKSASYYMIRLLVTMYDDESEVRTFYVKDGKWSVVHVLYGSNTTAYDQMPEDFMYPHYDFYFKFAYSPAKAEAEAEKEMETKTLDVDDSEDYSGLDSVQESYFDMTGDYYNYKVHDDDVDFEEPPAKRPSLKNPLSIVSYKKTSVFDLSSNVKSSEFKLRYVDNVAYKLYKFNWKDAPTEIVDKDDVIWTAKSASERCVYAMAPRKGGFPVALYLIINSAGKLRGEFFANVFGVWVPSNLSDYKFKLNFLKMFGAHYPWSMDLSIKTENFSSYVEYNDEKVPNYLFLPKTGYDCTKVTYKDTTIWEASEVKDKCIAVWSYECFDRPYYVRMIITSPSGKSDLVSYFNTTGHWEKLSSYNESFQNRTKISLLSNFYNPEYEFSNIMRLEYVYENDKNKEREGSQPESKGDDLYKSTCSNVQTIEKSGSFDSIKKDLVGAPVPKTNESDLTSVSKDKEDKTPTLPVENDVPEKTVNPLTHEDYKKYLNPFTENKLLQIDLASPLSIAKYKMEAVFDGKLRLVSYHAPPGTYFDMVSQSKNQLFAGTSNTKLCYAINIYLKQDDLYLCDLLVRSRDFEMTIYYKKEDDVWIFVDPKEYSESLMDLKESIKSKTKRDLKFTNLIKE